MDVVVVTAEGVVVVEEGVVEEEGAVEEEGVVEEGEEETNKHMFIFYCKLQAFMYVLSVVIF